MKSAIAIACLLVASTAHAAEICGDGADNDNNGLTDEGCYPSMRTGVCESPLSCMDTGWLSWATGSLHYDLPPDIAPQSPYGPDIGFRRFYTSMYSPPSGGAFNRTPLGARWQHNYMSWIDRLPSGDIVIHTPQGEDVLAKSLGLSDTIPPFERFQLQTRQQFLSIQFRNGRYQADSASGATLYYNAAGQLVEVVEGPLASGMRIKLTWGSTARGSAVSTVTDATTRRRLMFGYDASGYLRSVSLQFRYGSSADPSVGWSTYKAMTDYRYQANALVDVRRQAVDAAGHADVVVLQSMTYTNGLLSNIDDAEGHSLVQFRHASTGTGRTTLIDTPTGVVGLDLGSTRGTCTNKTILYFNKANSNACSNDGDCGSGAMCGGQTGGPGKTGTCFRAARCITVDASGGESLVTDVAPIGPGTESCTGACAEITRYVWNVDSQDLLATSGFDGYRTTTKYDANGFPTQIVFADPDDDPTNGNGARTMWLFWEGARLKEIRKPSVLSTVASSCSASNETGCARTIYLYESGRLKYFQQTGTTLNSTGGQMGISQVTTYTYDDKGRVRIVDGPQRAADGSNNYDITEYTYKDDSSDPTQLGFLHSRAFHHTIPTLGEKLYDYVWSYDFWGNAIDWTGMDGGRSCARYNLLLNYEEWSSIEAGLGDCAVDDPADLIEETIRDTSLRPWQVKNADGSCVHYVYDVRGRLEQVKRRDDCIAGGAPGERQRYFYDADGLPTEIVVYTSTDEEKQRTKLTYDDSRRLESVINPVDATKATSIEYTPYGDISRVSTTGDLGLTWFVYDRLRQLVGIQAHKTPSTPDTWGLEFDSHGNRNLVADPDGKQLRAIYDDLGRRVRQESPDQSMMPSITSYTVHDRIETNSDPTQMRSFTYDPFGRLLTADYQGQCAKPDPATQPRSEVQNIYDALPLENRYQCPIAGGCNNLKGRVAYRRSTLMCSSAFLDDGALDQETFYSYDSMGRLVAEYIRDDSGRVAPQKYVWSKSGLAEATMPSNATVRWSYGSTASNSDSDRVTAVYRAHGVIKPVIDNVLYNAFGPVAQYNRMDTISGSALRMKFAYNVAYRPTSIVLEGQNGVGPYYRLALGEDGKGRVTSRVYSPKHPQLPGVHDSFFRYDMQDRLLCETHTAVATCPSVGATTVKNSHPLAFTGAGDRKTMIHGQQTNVFTLFDGMHRIKTVDQTGGSNPLGITDYTYDDRGNRKSEDSASVDHDRRDYVYDGRGNVKTVYGAFLTSGLWRDYGVTSAFDARNRRVFKSFTDLYTSKQTQWFFYYDPYDRLTEVRHIPDAADSNTFSTYQLIWLEDLLVAYWQTDYRSGTPDITTSKRYVSPDEQGRPVRMHNWPTSGNSTVVWATNPDAWGADQVTMGSNIFQPIGFPGQYIDVETAAYASSTVQTRPPLSLNGARTYDPFTGSYLQLDPLVHETWSPYMYAENNPVGNTDASGLAANQGPGSHPGKNCTESWSINNRTGEISDYQWSCSYSEPILAGLTPGERGSVFSGKGGVTSRRPETKKGPKKPAPKPARPKMEPIGKLEDNSCSENLRLIADPAYRETVPGGLTQYLQIKWLQEQPMAYWDLAWIRMYALHCAACSDKPRWAIREAVICDVAQFSLRGTLYSP